MTRTTQASPPPDLLVRSKGPGTAPGPFVVPGVPVVPVVPVPWPAGPCPRPCPSPRGRTTRRFPPADVAQRAAARLRPGSSSDVDDHHTAGPATSATRHLPASRSHNTPTPTHRRRTTCRRTSPAPADPATSATTTRHVLRPRPHAATHPPTSHTLPPHVARPGSSGDLDDVTRQVLRPRPPAAAARPAGTPRGRSTDRSRTVARRPANRRLVTSRRETHGKSADRRRARRTTEPGQRSTATPATQTRHRGGGAYGQRTKPLGSDAIATRGFSSGA